MTTPIWVGRAIYGARSNPIRPGDVYANNLGAEGEDRVREAYSENYARLVAIKTKYDPTKVFRPNQNIKPIE